MNKDNAHLYIPLIEALRDDELQLKHCGNWVGVIDTDFHEPPETYRRKPKPREFWVNVYADDKPGTFYAHEVDAKRLKWTPDGKTIRVREVID